MEGTTNSFLLLDTIWASLLPRLRMQTHCLLHHLLGGPKTPKKAMRIVEKAALKDLKVYVKKNCPAVAPKQEKLDILLLQEKL